MRVIALGVHVVDVLVRPVEEIPAGQGGQLVEQIRITPAGTAGGTAVTLAKLGARTDSAGAIGTDALGDVMIDLLARHGVSTDLLVRRDSVQTSASVLPIRPDGSRPAFHVVGANANYASADAPWDEIAQATHLHVGAPEFMGGEEAAKVLSFAHEHGVVTSADLLAPGEQAQAIFDWIAPALAHLDYLLPNEEQALGLTGEDEITLAARALVQRGVGCVAATCGARGAVIVDADESIVGTGLRHRGRRYHRLWRRLLGRVPTRALTRTVAACRGGARMCGGRAGRSRPGLRPR